MPVFDVPYHCIIKSRKGVHVFECIAYMYLEVMMKREGGREGEREREREKRERERERDEG